MFVIYSFHAAQKQELPEFDNYILSLIEKFKIQGDYQKYFHLYGKECVLISLYLNPLRIGQSLNEKDLFCAWKFLNKLWYMLNREAGGVDDLAFEKYLGMANNNYEKGKYHLFISSLFHIIKLSKHSGLSESQKNELLCCLAHKLRYLHRYKNNRNIN
jgi:hypothetical protein